MPSGGSFDTVERKSSLAVQGVQRRSDFLRLCQNLSPGRILPSVCAENVRLSTSGNKFVMQNLEGYAII